MPRPPNPSNVRNPLRLLRISLADKNQAMMTQLKLGEILGISPETIKSLEVGRRHQGALSRQIVTAAVVYCGAKWNPKKSQWENLSGQAYDRSHFELWRNASFDREEETKMLCDKLAALLSHTPNKLFPVISDMVCDAMDDIRDRYQVPIKNEPGLKFSRFNLGLGLIEVVDADGNVSYMRSRNYNKDRDVGFGRVFVKDLTP